MYPFENRFCRPNWPEWYQDLPSLFVVLMSPKAGNGRSSCERAMVGLLKPLPGRSPANGFATGAVRKVLLAIIAGGPGVVRVQVLVRQGVDVAEDLDVVAVVADVRGLEGEAARAARAGSRSASGAASRSAGSWLKKEIVLPEGRLPAERVADRLQDRLGEERVSHVPRDGRAEGVGRGADGGRLRRSRSGSRRRAAGRGSRRTARCRRGRRSCRSPGRRSRSAAGRCSSASLYSRLAAVHAREHQAAP